MQIEFRVVDTTQVDPVLGATAIVFRLHDTAGKPIPILSVQENPCAS